MVDPTGHFCISAIIIGAIVGAVIGAGIVGYQDYKDDGKIFNGSKTVGNYLMGAAVGGVVGAAAGTAVAAAAGGTAATAGLSALGKAAVSAGSAGAIGAGTNAAMQAASKGITNVDGKEAALAGVKSAAVAFVCSGISTLMSSGSSPSSSSVPNTTSHQPPTLHSSGKQHGDAIHYSQITDKVESMTNSNMYSDIYVNRGIRRVLPGAVKNYRPDVMGLRYDGLVDIFEVQSPSQTIQFMQDKVNKLSDMLGDKAGVVDFIRRIVK